MNSNKRWYNTMNTHKTVEEIVRKAIASVTREDDGLLDIGKHDHELLAELITEALDTHSAHLVEKILELAPGLENTQTGEVTYDLGVMEYMARIKAIDIIKDNK